MADTVRVLEGPTVDLHNRRLGEQGPPSCKEPRHGGVGPGALVVLLVGALVDVLDLLDEVLWLRVLRQETDADAAGSFVEGNSFPEKCAELSLALCRDANPKLKPDGCSPRVPDR